MKQEITATLEALCGIAEATQIDNVAILFNFLMDFLNNCIGLMEVYKNTPETVNLIIEVFVEVAHKQICYLGEVNTTKRGRRRSVCMCVRACVVQNSREIFVFYTERTSVCLHHYSVYIEINASWSHLLEEFLCLKTYAPKD